MGAPEFTRNERDSRIYLDPGWIAALGTVDVKAGNVGFHQRVPGENNACPLPGCHKVDDLHRDWYPVTDGPFRKVVHIVAPGGLAFRPIYDTVSVGAVQPPAYGWVGQVVMRQGQAGGEAGSAPHGSDDPITPGQVRSVGLRMAEIALGDSQPGQAAASIADVHLHGGWNKVVLADPGQVEMDAGSRR